MFKNVGLTVDAINQYLIEVLKEATSRGYHFDEGKIDYSYKPQSINVTRGQLQYEVTHLLQKLEVRDHERFKRYNLFEDFKPHPLFTIVEGDIEFWEKV